MSNNNTRFTKTVGNFVPPRKRSYPAMKNAVAKQAIDERARSQEFASQVRMRCEAFLERIIKASLFLEEIEVTVANFCHDVGRENELYYEKKKKVVAKESVEEETSSSDSSSEDDDDCIEVEDY